LAKSTLNVATNEKIDIIHFCPAAAELTTFVVKGKTTFQFSRQNPSDRRHSVIVQKEND
jgi:hypothetical protein